MQSRCSGSQEDLSNVGPVSCLQEFPPVQPCKGVRPHRAPNWLWDGRELNTDPTVASRRWETLHPEQMMEKTSHWANPN